MLARMLAFGIAVFAPVMAEANCVGVLLPGPQEAVIPLLTRFQDGLRNQGNQIASVPLAIAYALPGSDAGQVAARLPEDCSVMVGASLREVRALAARFPDKAIITIAVGDPVGAGLVQSFERPGGRISGLSDFKPEYAEGRLLLARELVPSLSRIAFIYNPDAPTARLTFDAAERHGIELAPLVARTTADLQARLQELAEIQAQALIVVPYPLTFANRRAIAEAGARCKLPVIFGYGEFMDLEAPAAGIASLGADLGDLYRRAAGYVADLLAGVDPAGLPIGTPQRDQLILNAAVARQLDLPFSDDLWARATRVIE